MLSEELAIMLGEMDADLKYIQKVGHHFEFARKRY